MIIWHGNFVHADHTAKRYRLNSTNELVKDDLSNLICPHCKRPPTKEGHDACLGTLKGVKYACCGHGGHPYRTKKNTLGNTYVMEEDGKCYYGEDVNFEKYR